ncbi:hypothetical protein UlMin_008707 [Ulmus minor]
MLILACRVKDDYLKGAWNFVKSVEKKFGHPEKILCPCRSCRNLSHQPVNEVYEHLVIKGMDPTYTQWYFHGEDVNGDEEMVGLNVGGDAYDLYRAAFMNDEAGMEEPTQMADQKFNEHLNDAETPLYPSCKNYTKLSAIVALYKLKTTYRMSNRCFNGMLEILHDMLPSPNHMIKSMQETKIFLKTFDLGFEKIHACVNDCCLFRGNEANADICRKCGASRWKLDKQTKKIKKSVPAKVLIYFPIIPRFQRMFRSKEMAEELRWHFEHKRGDGKMDHPADSAAWELVDDKWPTFASDPRNLRLGLATDGFNPFSNLSSTYSCWPVMLVTYNLPPWLCMKKENIMLSLLIPGPRQPGNDIDIYLQPLIDDLKLLWNEGAIVYDAFDNTNFNLRALLLWTVNDFPAYGNLAGCSTKGKFACPVCANDTKSRWLTFSRKFAYMGHRRFLPPSHTARKKMSWFDGDVEKGSKPRIMTGRRIYDTLENFVNEWGKSSKKRKRKEDEDEAMMMWKKRSIFFELPYWKVLKFPFTFYVSKKLFTWFIK